MNSLFNTQDNQEFLGIRSDASLNKANKKGTPQYEEWLRKYREKRGHKEETSSSEISPSDKDKERVKSLLSFAREGNIRAITNRLSQIKDEKKLQSRYDLLKESLSKDQLQRINSLVSGTIPSLKKEKAEKEEQKQRYKNHIKARLEPLFKKWNEKFLAHFKKITDQDKANQRLSMLKDSLGSDNPALEGLQEFIDKNATIQKKRGWTGDYKLERKNRERVKALVDEYSKEFNEYGLTTKDFELISDVGDGFYSKLKEML